jgi:hypothetical protein
MKSFDSDLKKYADKIRLKTSERSALRERILSYMEYHPLPKQKESLVPFPSMLESQPFHVFHITRRTMRLAAGFMVLTLVVLPFAAERSIPGDVLYLVKTGFNESVQAQLVNSPYEKIEFETKLIERRIAEARSLADQGKLTDEVKTQLAETVKTHTQNVSSEITELGTQDSDGAAIARIAFSSSLEVQSAVLNASAGEDEEAPIGSILLVVDEARGEASVAAEGEPAPSYEGLLAKIESETTRAYELFESVKSSATQDESQDIERRLNDVNRLITEAKDTHEQTTTADIALVATGTAEQVPATEKLASTLSAIHKLIVFMTDIDVRETVELESIVPVVLSDAERLAPVRDALPARTEQMSRITAALPTVTDAGMKEKITLGVGRADALVVAIQGALETGDVSVAESSYAELAALATDLELLVSAPVTLTSDSNPEAPVEVGTTTATSTDSTGGGDVSEATEPTETATY